MSGKSPLEEKTMSPLILLLRLGLENYLPHQHNRPQDNNYSVLEGFRNHLVEHLWKEQEKLTPSKFYNVVEFVSHEQAYKSRDAPIECNYLAKILQHAVFEWIPEIDLGDWGDDLKKVYHEHMFENAPSRYISNTNQESELKK